MKFNRFTLVMAAFPFVLYACGSDDSGGGGGTGGKKDAGTDSGKGGTGGGTGGVGAIGGTGGAGLTGGTGGTAGTATGGTAGAAGTATGGTAGAAGSASGGTAGVAGSASGGTAGVAGSATGGTAGVGPDASVGGSAGASTGGTAGTDGGTLPTGDTCADAFVVGALPFVASSTTAGAAADYGYGTGACLPETGSAGSAAPDHVYSFTPATTGKYQIALTSAVDSALYVATDCANIDTTCVAGDEDICSNCTETLTLDATAGTTYYLFVDGYQTSGTPAGGAYTLSVDPIAPPTNDTCATATAITTLPYYQVGDTTTAGSDYGFGANSCAGVPAATGSGANDLVYSFTPATSGSYIVNLTTTFDSALYIATDCSMINATCLGASDAACSNCTESQVINATAGTTYYLFVDGWQTSPTPSNSGVFALSVSTPPPGDTCGTALPVTSVPFTDSGNTSGAINDYGYAAGTCQPANDDLGGASNDIVYSFTPSVTGSYTITLGGFDATLYVVTDCSNITSTTCLGGVDDCATSCDEELTLTLTAGTPYFIVVDGWSDSSNVAGPYQLDIIKNP